MINIRFGVITALILAAVATRLAMSGVPNISPITAVALFSGACVADRRLAILIPLAAMFISDLVLGLHNTMFFVYGAFILVVLVGMLISGRWHTIIAASLGSSVLFFLLTNFGVWVMGDIYPLTSEGLVVCYTAAIPFFRMTLLGDLFFTVLIFGLFVLLERLYPSLRKLPGHCT